MDGMKPLMVEHVPEPVQHVPRHPSVKGNMHVITVDPTRHALAAFEYAIQNTPKDDGFVLVNGLHQHHRPKVYPKETTMYEPIQENQRGISEYRALMSVFASKCKAARRHCEFEGVKFFGPGDLGEGVNDAARRHRASSIIVGSRGMAGQAGQGGWFLGSVSQSILNRAVLPVTIVRSKEEGEYHRGDAAFEYIKDAIHQDPNAYGMNRAPVPAVPAVLPVNPPTQSFE
jgi:Universal stress protein family